MTVNSTFAERRAVADVGLEPLGFEQLTGLSASKGLQSVPDGAVVALFQVDTQNVRWRDDGNAPTSSVGMQLKSEAQMTYNGDLDAIRFIEEAASGVVNVSYYK